MKNIFFALFCTLITFQLNAQTCEHKADIYQAYLSADQSSWEKCIAELNTAYDKSGADQDLLNLAMAQYASYSAYMAKKDKEGAQEVINKAETNTKIYLENNAKSPEANALLSGIYGMQIALSPMKGMSLGSRTGNLLDKALKNDPNSAFANYQQGSSLYYTPRMWGGDVPKSIDYLTKAKELYETQGTENEWNYLNVLSVLGQAYHYQEEYEKAKSTYDQALSIAPGFGWVKYNLMPKLEEDMK